MGIKQNFASFVNVHSQTRVFEMHKTLKPDETFFTSRDDQEVNFTHKLVRSLNNRLLIQLCDPER